MERRTPRLWLRPLRSSDRAEWVRSCVVSEPLVQPWSPLRPPGFTWDAQFDRVFLQNAGDSALRLASFLPDGRIAGLFSLTEIARGPFQNAYAGWSANVEVAGLGYTTEAVRLMLDIAFAPTDGLALHRVQANIIPRNERSIRLAEKCGFRREGLAIRYLEIAGTWEDHAMYARLSDSPDQGAQKPD